MDFLKIAEHLSGNTNLDGFRIEESQGDGWLISTEWGHIDYRPTDCGVNEIWWIESHKRGHGCELVDLMQSSHPADHIAWGATSEAGAALMEKYHRLHPEISFCNETHEGQYNPF